MTVTILVLWMQANRRQASADVVLQTLIATVMVRLIASMCAQMIQTSGRMVSVGAEFSTQTLMAMGSQTVTTSVLEKTILIVWASVFALSLLSKTAMATGLLIVEMSAPMMLQKLLMQELVAVGSGMLTAFLQQPRQQEIHSQRPIGTEMALQIVHHQMNVPTTQLIRLYLSAVANPLTLTAMEMALLTAWMAAH
jgi:hypothetical protein